MTITTEDQEKIRPLAEKEAKKLLKHEDFRNKTKEIVAEYTKTVEFEEMVQKYAGKEIDNRTLKGAKYWKNVLITAVITAAFTIIAGVGLYLILPRT